MSLRQRHAVDLPDVGEREFVDRLDRVVRFEQDHAAPAHFDERLTVLEVAAESNE